MNAEPPTCLPLVEVLGGAVGHLLGWERHEDDGLWHAWVCTIRITAGRVSHEVRLVEASALTRIEEPGAYRHVPRRVVARGGAALPHPAAGHQAEFR